MRPIFFVLKQQISWVFTVLDFWNNFRTHVCTLFWLWEEHFCFPLLLNSKTHYFDSRTETFVFPYSQILRHILLILGHTIGFYLTLKFYEILFWLWNIHFFFSSSQILRHIILTLRQTILFSLTPKLYDILFWL
jgi:hypothetical protein